MNKTNPKIVVLIGVIFVSFSSILIRFSNAPALIISAYRMTFTVILLSPYVLIKNIDEFKKIEKKQLLMCILSGVFLALHFATWITSIKYTSVASSTILVCSHPIFIVLFSYFIFKEKVSSKALISILIAFVGSIIISLGDSTQGSNILFGDILAILGALFVAGYMIIGGIIRQKLSVTVYTFIVYFCSTITLFILNIIAEKSLYPYPLKEWAIFLGLSIFCTILGHTLYNWSLKYIKPSFLSTSSLGEPVFATIWALLILDEYPTVWNITGGIIVILGIYMFINIDKKNCTHSQNNST